MYKTYLISKSILTNDSPLCSRLGHNFSRELLSMVFLPTNNQVTLCPAEVFAYTAKLRYLEPIAHIFFNCLVKDIWIQTIKYYKAPQNNNLVVNLQNCLHLLAHCLIAKAIKSSRALILYKIVFIIWKSMNK